MNKVTKFAIVSRDDSESIKISKDIQRYLFNNGMAYADKDPDIVCVVGGDGTFLTAIHKYINKLDQVVFAAVNTGTLGFFADYTVEELDQYVSDIVNKQPNIENKKLLKITVNGKERKTYLAVNEMRIENVIKTQTIDVYINEKKLETYRGTGLCVCTQVGSTAYNRSLRGAVVEAGMEIMELTEITGIHHIHYRSLGVPIIMSGNNTIRMLSKYDDTSLLCFDRYAINLDGAESIETTLSDVEFKVARYRKTDYIDHLYHLYT